jgi:hypothetical protein
MEITVNIPDDDLVSGISDLSKPNIKALIRGVLFEQEQDEGLIWEVIAECLESLRTQYAEEADWYTERELKETFENPEYGSPPHYDQIRAEALTYQSATDHVLHHVRDILSGKPERVG